MSKQQMAKTYSQLKKKILKSLKKNNFKPINIRDYMHKNGFELKKFKEQANIFIGNSKKNEPNLIEGYSIFKRK